MSRGMNVNSHIDKGTRKNRLSIVKEQDLTREFEDKLIDWCTFYRRNIHRFVEHYLGINLYFYQKIMLYMMNLYPQVVLLCSRAMGKSFLSALLSCSVCILYPNSKIVVTAKRKKTAELIVVEKIEKELMTMSPNLKREIKKISTNNNRVEVIFYNGSSIVVCACNDDARGQRATCILVDEFRQVDKTVVDSVFSPMLIQRQVPYVMNEKYSHLREDPREIYLSSCWYKSHWMWELVKDAILGHYNGTSICLSFDYSISVKHGIRSHKQMKKEKQKMSTLVFDMEYNNIMVGGTSNQYYSFDLVTQAQKIKKAWYPMPPEEFALNKRTWFGNIKKQDGEIRIVALDIAMMATTKGKTANDLSVMKCVRVLRNGNKYERQEVYTETMEGADIETQAVKVRRIMQMFDANYLVFDARTYGINLTDCMAKTLYDDLLDIEYAPICVFNNKELADRCKNNNASPIMWAFIGTSDSNHRLHTAMLGSLMDKKYKMLISDVHCKEEYLNDKKEYQGATMEQKALYELPYIHSDLTLNEMINLRKEYVGGGKISLVEPRNGLKDKYMTSAMANLFVQEELEVNLTEKESSFDVNRAIRFRRPKTHY